MMDYCMFTFLVQFIAAACVSGCTTGETYMYQEDWLCLAGVAGRTIHDLRWTDAAVIHDRHSVVILHKLQDVKMWVYEIDDRTPLTDILHHIHKMLFPHVHVIVALESAVLLRLLLHEANIFDQTTNHSTDFSHHSKWLVFTKENFIFLNGSVTEENLQNMAVLSCIYGQTACSTKILSLKSVDGGFRFLPVNDTMSFPKRLFPNTEYGYNGQYLRVSTVESSPFAMPANKADIPYVGFCMDVLRTIVEHLNMTVKYVAAEDGVWGWIDNGMLGQLKRREIDLAASDLHVHAARVGHVDFIKPYLYTDERVLSYKMPPATQPIFLLAGPFQLSVYGVYLAVTFSVIIFILLTETLGHFTSTIPKRKISYLLWELFKPPFKQGLFRTTLTTPSGVLLIFWWLLVILVSSLYCGNLTATFATNTPLRKFTSINELVDSDFSMGFLGGGIMGHLLENSTRDDIRALYAKFVRLNVSDPHLTSDRKDFLMERVKDGHYAFISFKSLVDVLIAEDCTLSMVYFDDRTKTPLTFAVQKNSPFKDDIGKVMEKLESGGILIQLWKKWNNISEAGTCDRGKRSVTMAELTGAGIVTGAGVVLASVLLFLEWMYTRCKSK